MGWNHQLEICIPETAKCFFHRRVVTPKGGLVRESTQKPQHTPGKANMTTENETFEDIFPSY